MNEIKWDLDEFDIPYSLGRNGYMKTVGITVYRVMSDLHIYPLNTRGTGRCRITIPFSKIDNLIELLEAIKTQSL